MLGVPLKEHTISVHHADWANAGNAYTLYINDRGSSDMASFSRMFIYEVAQ